MMIGGGICKKQLDHNKKTFLQCHFFCDGGEAFIYGDSKKLGLSGYFRVELPNHDDGPFVGTGSRGFVLYRKR